MKMLCKKCLETGEANTLRWGCDDDGMSFDESMERDLICNGCGHVYKGMDGWNIYPLDREEFALRKCMPEEAEQRDQIFRSVELLQDTGFVTFDEAKRMIINSFKGKIDPSFAVACILAAWYPKPEPVAAVPGPLPIPLPKLARDWKNVEALAKTLLEEQRDEVEDTDTMHYLGEAVVKAIYGDDVFDQMRELGY